MENELKKLNEYFKMGANLPKNEFAKVFIDVVRKGSSDEIKNAYALLNNLATIPELENFCQKGIEIYKDILKSNLNSSFIILFSYSLSLKTGLFSSKYLTILPL